MLFKDLEFGKTFIDTEAIFDNTKALGLFQKTDPQNWGVEVDSKIDGLAINKKTSQPTLFSLQTNILEIEM